MQPRGSCVIQGACRDPAVGDVDFPARKVNTPFRQDGLSLRVPSDTSCVVFSVSDRCVGFWTACSAERSDEDVGITRDERFRVHNCRVFTFCAVCCDATNS